MWSCCRVISDFICFSNTTPATKRRRAASGAKQVLSAFEEKQLSILEKEVEAKDNYYKQMVAIEREKLEILKRVHNSWLWFDAFVSFHCSALKIKLEITVCTKSYHQ